MGWTLRLYEVQFNYEASPILFQDLSLELKSDRVYALIGPNGSGKSTFIALITGILSPQRGSITLRDDDLGELSLRSYVLASFQNPDKIFSQLKVYNELTYTLKLKGYSEEEIQRRLSQILKSFHWTYEFLKEDLDSLSYGWKRLVALAEYLVLDGKLLCLDEPTANLHSSWRWAFWRHVALTMRNREDFSFLFTTHRGEELLIADEILLIADKRVIEMGHRDLVQRAEGNDYLRALVNQEEGLRDLLETWSADKARELRESLLSLSEGYSLERGS